MNFPNALTILRFLFTIAFIFFALQDTPSSWIIAASLFTVAALTDYWDGYLARKYKLDSDFGKIMDPIADKFLILSAFFIFMKLHLIPAWMFYVVAAREILVTVSRLCLMKKGKVLAAEREGKLKTVIQIVAVFVCLGILVLNEIVVNKVPFPAASVWGQQATLALEYVLVQIVMSAAVGLTLFSGVKYFWHNRQNFI